VTNEKQTISQRYAFLSVRNQEQAITHTRTDLTKLYKFIALTPFAFAVKAIAELIIRFEVWQQPKVQKIPGIRE